MSGSTKALIKDVLQNLAGNLKNKNVIRTYGSNKDGGDDTWGSAETETEGGAGKKGRGAVKKSNSDTANSIYKKVLARQID